MTTDAQLADLVAAIVSVARHFQHRTHDDDRIVSLSPLERVVVRHVYRYPGISPTTLAADLGLQASNASTALRLLDERGFITRTPDPADRRASRLSITPLAWESIGLVRARFAQTLREQLGDDIDLASLASAMEDLDHRLIAASRKTAGHQGPEPRPTPGEHEAPA